MSTPEPPTDTPLPDLVREDAPPRHLAVRLVLLALALLFFVAGLVVWLTPIIGGAIVLYVLAALCLGASSPAAARWVNRNERRLPRKLRRLLRLGRKDEPTVAAGDDTQR